MVRRKARRALRLASLILYPAGLYNYLEFDLHAIVGSGLPTAVAGWYRITNLVAMIFAVIAVWYLAFPLLETIASAIRRLVASKVPPDPWQAVVHEALLLTPWLALPGALLWASWVQGFYRSDIDFQLLSSAVGVPAHLLAATVYLPIGVGWYRLARQTRDADD